MLKNLAALALILISVKSFAGSCLIDYGQETKKACVEYKSNNDVLIDGFQKACDANPNGTWLNGICPNAKYGCFADMAGYYSMTTWFVNGEPKEAVEQACKALNSTLIVNQ